MKCSYVHTMLSQEHYFDTFLKWWLKSTYQFCKKTQKTNKNIMRGWFKQKNHFVKQWMFFRRVTKLNSDLSLWKSGFNVQFIPRFVTYDCAYNVKDLSSYHTFKCTPGSEGSTVRLSFPSRTVSEPLPFYPYSSVLLKTSWTGCVQATTL